METNTAFTRIAGTIDKQDPHTAPKAVDGSIHQGFIGLLKLIFTPEAAEIAQHLNCLPGFTSTPKAAAVSGKSIEHVETILAESLSKGGVVQFGGQYCLSPIPNLLNAHNFHPEVKPDDVEAARLHGEYFIKDGFSKFYQSTSKGTPVGRVIPIGRTIETDQKVLAAEEAHDFILNHAAEELTLIPCPCRTRAEKRGDRECRGEFPIGYCIMLGAAAVHFETMGLGKRVTKEEAIEYFDGMVELGLLGHTLNTRFGDRLICLCCGCCCAQTLGRIKWGNPNALAPSNFIPKAGEDCIGCEMCTERCLFEALSLDKESERIRVDPKKCLGCGLCSLACPQETLKLHRSERSSIPFENSIELDITMGRENREE